MSNKNPKIQAKIWEKFKTSCHQAIILGYNVMMKKELIYKEWEEEDISAVLYEEMRKLPFVKTKNISISTEIRLYDEAILTGKKKAKKADRIDLKFSKWFFSTEREYYGEAKNVSCKNWKKTTETEGNVDASKYRDRYIKTGIERLMFGKYADLDGFLIGYIVNGSSKDNVTALNRLIKRRKLPPKVGLIENQYTIEKHTECYISKNIKEENEINLHHLFLEFDKSEQVTTHPKNKSPKTTT